MIFAQLIKKFLLSYVTRDFIVMPLVLIQGQLNTANIMLSPRVYTRRYGLELATVSVGKSASYAAAYYYL